MMIDKVIILDIDGCIATTKQMLLSYNSKSYIKKYSVYPFDKKCVNILNEILNKTGAEIILSSDWRLFYNIEQLDDIFKINNVNKSPLFTTPKYSSKFSAPLEYNRIIQINNVLNNNKINNYIVIDDLDMSKAFGEAFIHCKYPSEGIKQTGIKEKIISKLLQ